MENTLNFYIIDDDESLVITLKTLISKVFPKAAIFTAFNGIDGLELIEKQTTVSIIISDIYMPDFSGLQLLKKVRGTPALKSHYFMLMTSSQDVELNLKGIQAGADDFITKPFAVDQLIAKLRNATRILNLQDNLKLEKEVLKNLYLELKEDSNKIRDFLIEFQEKRIPKSKDFLASIAEAANWIAKEMGETDLLVLESITNAAKLAYLGRITLPDNMLKEEVMPNGVIKYNQLEQVPKDASEFTSKLRGYKEVSEILLHIYENFDGSGFPDAQMTWQIPFGSRILRVLLDFFEIVEKGKVSPSKVFESLEKEAKRVYDLKIIVLLDQYMAFKGIGCAFGKEMPIDFKDLKKGHFLTRSIYSESGLKLIGSGVFLDDEKIEKIFTISETEKIIGKVWVRR